MTDRILALVDGSAYSESVCHHTAWIAARLRASVDVMHVLGRREIGSTQNLSGALTLGARSALLEELASADESRARLAQARGRAILEDAQAILQAKGVGQVTPHLRKGDILEAVQEAEPDLRAIVIGKCGEGAEYATAHLGSNLERIVRASKVPVFVASRAFAPIGRVLVAFDGSASAQKAVQRMSVSPVFQGLQITLLYVGEPTPALRGKLDDAVRILGAAGLTADTRIAPGEPEDVLQSVASAEGFGLLVMGAYGHSRIRSLIIGSTTTTMVQAVRIPVLMYR
ncbi:universal stress protein [Paracoccus liaowanqingii]|uniref:Universal stress protein n=1 Tax=Paracoccus liaowanqingii TaxID=2560053 RepID=A0A4P7HMM6_9RHOB|nr:universal stress protein [Paracoccus liaowanqingii]QBX34933.1 universal stress protein [Paracoccus liaowanqingii]